MRRPSERARDSVRHPTERARDSVLLQPRDDVRPQLPPPLPREQIELIEVRAEPVLAGANTFKKEIGAYVTRR